MRTKLVPPLNVRDIPDFVNLTHDLGVKHLNIIPLIDGDEVVNKADNLVYHPDLLVPNVTEAVRRGKALNVNVYVGPAYQENIDHYTERSTVAA